MSNVSTMRTAIHAALATLLPGVDVKDAVVPEHCWGLALRKPTVVLSYRGTVPRGTDELSTVKQSLVFAWTLAVVSESWQAPDAAGRTIEDVAQTLRGTAGVEDGLRAAEIITLRGNGLRLRFQSERVEVPSDRPEQGGPAAIVQEYVTFPEVIL